MSPQAYPDPEWQRRRTIADTVRLLRDIIAGALAFGGFIALLVWLFLFWTPGQ